MKIYCGFKFNSEDVVKSYSEYVITHNVRS
jgi:hypothetical protein